MNNISRLRHWVSIHKVWENLINLLTGVARMDALKKMFQARVKMRMLREDMAFGV